MADKEKNQHTSFTEELVGSHLLKILSYYPEMLYEKRFEDMYFVLKKLLINKVDDEWAVPVTPGSCYDVCRYQANATTVEKDPSTLHLGKSSSKVMHSKA